MGRKTCCGSKPPPRLVARHKLYPKRDVLTPKSLSHLCHICRTMPGGFFLGHWSGPRGSTLSVQYDPVPRWRIWPCSRWRSKLGRHLRTIRSVGIWGRWEFACRRRMPKFYRRSGDSADCLVGTLSGISAKRVSEFTDIVVCMVATWPTTWLSYCLGVPYKLYL